MKIWCYIYFTTIKKGGQAFAFVLLWPFLSAQSTDNACIGTGANQTRWGDKHEDKSQHIKGGRTEGQTGISSLTVPNWPPPYFLLWKKIKVLFFLRDLASFQLLATTYTPKRYNSPLPPLGNQISEHGIQDPSPSGHNLYLQTFLSHPFFSCRPQTPALPFSKHRVHLPASVPLPLAVPCLNVLPTTPSWQPSNPTSPRKTSLHSSKTCLLKSQPHLYSSHPYLPNPLASLIKSTFGFQKTTSNHDHWPRPPAGHAYSHPDHQNSLQLASLFSSCLLPTSGGR